MFGTHFDRYILVVKVHNLFVTNAKIKKNAKKISRFVAICKFCLYLQKISVIMAQNNTKKRLVTSFNNLTTEQQDEVKALYPRGFAEVMTRIDKPNGDFFYVIPYETDEISYMVKIDVKVDDGADEEENDDMYADDDLKGADELADDDMSDEEM